MKVCLALCLAFVALTTIANGAEKKPDEKEIRHENQAYRFDQPVRIEAGGKVVSVESPGYACPTMADVDGDGKQDLVVGQFKKGNMQFCKNVAEAGQPPKFAAAAWLTIGDERLEVPGVW